MDIFFRVPDRDVDVADLIRDIQRPGYGIDEDFSTEARLVIFDWESSRLTRYWRPDASPVRENKYPVEMPIDDGHREYHGCLAIWFTAWSGFAYALSRSRLNGEPMWRYRGARKGFLQQNLLPSVLRDLRIADVSITGVVGTCGTFHGPDALERYKAQRQILENA